MLDVCCDLTPYETSRWLEMKPDRENVTAELEALLMARTQRQSECIVLVKTGCECQPEPTCRHTLTVLLWSVASGNAQRTMGQKVADRNEW